MSLQLGLGYSEDDIEVQGEIDFDFFDDPEEVRGRQNSNYPKNAIGAGSSKAVSSTGFSVSKLHDAPKIKISRSTDDCISRVSMETVIPSPEDYEGNYDRRQTSSQNKPKPSRVAALTNEKDFDDSSASSSSLSLSDSELTSFTDDSFEKSESDSMTDISPLPTHCHSPMVPERMSTSCPCKNPPTYPTSSSDLRNPISILAQDGHTFCPRTSSLKIGYTNNKSANVDELLVAMDKLNVKPGSSTGSKKSASFRSRNSLLRRKNMTFSNEEVRRIDQENKRLLKKILGEQTRKKTIAPPTRSRPASAGINRQKAQRQIELENLALLKRLESAKATPELQCKKQLKDYHKNTRSFSRPSSRPTSQLSLLSDQSLGNSEHLSAKSSGSQPEGKSKKVPINYPAVIRKVSKLQK